MTRQITPPLVAGGLLAILTLLMAGLGLASLNAGARKANLLPFTFNWTEDERARAILEVSHGPVALVGQQQKAKPLRDGQCQQQHGQQLPPQGLRKQPGQEGEALVHGSSLTSAARL